MNLVHHITASQFPQRVLRSTTPVLVDFFAPWCPPCRVLSPTLDMLAAEFGERLQILKVNSDEQPELAQQFGVEALPTLLFFQHGQVVDRVVGVQPIGALRTRLERFIGHQAA